MASSTKSYAFVTECQSFGVTSSDVMKSESNDWTPFDSFSKTIEFIDVIKRVESLVIPLNNIQ